MSAHDEAVKAALATYWDTPIDLCADSDEEQEKCVKSAVDAYNAALWQQQWRWMPFEASDDMLDAASDAAEGFHDIDEDKGPWLPSSGFAAAYHAMQVATPSPFDDEDA